MKTYPLDIIELREFEGGHMGWWSKGHHNKMEFLFEAAEFSNDALYIGIGYCRHEWWRCVPIPGERFICTVKAKPGTRGAFPVTVVED